LELIQQLEPFARIASYSQTVFAHLLPNFMIQQLSPQTTPEIIYPDSDGEPMADNTEV